MPFCFFFAIFKSDYPKWCHFTRDEYVCYKVVFAGVIGPYTPQLKETPWIPGQLNGHLNRTQRFAHCPARIVSCKMALPFCGFWTFFLSQARVEGGRHSWQGWSTFPKKFWPNYGNFYFGKVRAIEIDNCNALFKYHHVRLDSNFRQTWVTYYYGEKSI